MPDVREKTSLGRLSASLLPLAVVLVIEALRQSNTVPPIPFLLLFGSVIAAATLDGRRGAVISSLIAGSYIVYAYWTGFGPVNLVGSSSRVLLGIVTVAVVSLLLGQLQEHNRRLRRALEAHASAHYQALVDGAPEAICVADMDGRIVRGNPKFHEMFGIAARSETRYTIGDISADTQPDGRDSITAAREHIRHAVQRGAVVFEWSHRRINGEQFHAEVALSRLPGEKGDLVRGAVRDITRRKRVELLRRGESEALRLIANGRPMPRTLRKLTRVVEQVLPRAICSILLLDEETRCVRHGAAPSLSRNFRKAVDGLPIGPAAGSCGTAMYRAETVITRDTETDELWDAYRELARAEKLRACWSVPILDSGGNVRGSFAVYYRAPGEPETEELQILNELCSIAGIAIEQARRLRAIERSAELYRATFEQAAVGMAHVSTDGRYMRVNDEIRGERSDPRRTRGNGCRLRPGLSYRPSPTAGGAGSSGGRCRLDPCTSTFGRAYPVN
jgi:PAS domain S-box-containing protein